MELPTPTDPGLARQRRWIVIAAAYCLSVGSVQVWRAGGDDDAYTWSLGIGALSALLVLAAIIVTATQGLRRAAWASRTARPARLVRTGRGFAALHLPSVYPAPVALLTYGMFLSSQVAAWRRPDDPDPAIAHLNSSRDVVMTALLALMTITVAVLLVSTWRGRPLELTPAGLRARGPIFHRQIPWTALAQGGPPRPAPDANRLVLTVIRPDLVRQHGLILGWGPRDRPVIVLDVDVHPWFLADTIRWYVEHPEHRAAIGTEAEHTRLYADLTTTRPAV